MGGVIMDEDKLNMAIRQYLKKVGISSQREIEHAVMKAVEAGKLKGTESIEVKMTLSVPTLNINHQIDGNISLE
jgi:ribosomal protein L1